MTTLLSQWTFPYCPTAPNWTIEWDKLVSEFYWLRDLAGCPQNPEYHAEGDVLTHTRMVCEALIALSEWRQLPQRDRSILFAAALLHDVAKPACTKEDETGKLTSRTHVRQGARLARQILSELEQPPGFADRERVVALVQYGSLPIWLLDKPDPVKSAIRVSQVVRCDRVALLAEADVRGRQCRDREQLLERIQLFREFCQENQCLDKARSFPSAHSRFVYFHKENAYPDYEAFDDTRCEVVLMSGLPGSGKDCWIEENLPDWPVISLDRIRQELGISPEKDQGVVVAEAKERAKQWLRMGQSFIWNATNITRPMRQQLIDLFSAYNARIRIVYLEVPFAELVRRNRERKTPVPEAVLEKLAAKLDVPDRTEAHEVEWAIAS